MKYSKIYLTKINFSCKLFILEKSMKFYQSICDKFTNEARHIISYDFVRCFGSWSKKSFSTFLPFFSMRAFSLFILKILFKLYIKPVQCYPNWMIEWTNDHLCFIKWVKMLQVLATRLLKSHRLLESLLRWKWRYDNFPWTCLKDFDNLFY